MFAAVVGLGAFLLFQVQLVLGKQLLPWFGGTSAVWTTCLLFFQAALLAGYAWAHLVVGRLSARRQRDAHLALVGLALALVAWRAFAWPSPITPGEWARPASPEAPIRAILGLLGSTVGLPFVVLAATSPLLQAWFARLKPGASPFWLFALSNAGSLAGLVSYPLLVEPLASVRVQGWLWSLAFAAYAAGVASCAIAAGSRGTRRGRSHGHRGRDPWWAGGAHTPLAYRLGSACARSGDPARRTGGRVLAVALGRWRSVLWIALAFFPSVMLAAVTSHLTQEVAAVPLLWMLPLALYLLSFIVSFAWPDASRPAWRVALALAAALAAVGLHGGPGVGRDAARRPVVRDPLRVRHGGPRRARAPAAGAGAADRLLPRDRDGRRARGPAQRGRGAARLHGLLGAAPRDPGRAGGGDLRRSGCGSLVARLGGSSDRPSSSG